jgi:hypothetical protein
MTNQKLHIYKYVQSHIIILKQDVLVTPNTISVQIIIQKVL